MSNPSSVAVAAAINIAAQGAVEGSKPRARGTSKASQSAFAASLPAGGFANAAFHSSAVTDGPPLSSLPEAEKGSSSKSRIRRASEGSRLIKGENKKASAELRCEKCGKGYKHSSCLSKHLLVSPFPPLDPAVVCDYGHGRGNWQCDVDR